MLKKAVQILCVLLFVSSLIAIKYYIHKYSVKSSASNKIADSVGICGTPFVSPEDKKLYAKRKTVSASFIYGQDSLYSFIEKHIRYPSKALKNKIFGRVRVHFVVTEEGFLDSVKVFEPVSPELDKEAVRIIKLTDGSWNPAIRNGKPVFSRCIFPIEFVLE